MTDFNKFERSLVAFLRKRGDVRQSFLDLDLARNGSVSPQELQVGLQEKYEFTVPDDALDYLTKKYDAAGDGKFSYEEFCHLWDGEYTQFLTSHNLDDSLVFDSTDHCSARAMGAVHASMSGHQKQIHERVRNKLMQHEGAQGSEDLAALFISFDRDRSGSLTFSEVQYGLMLLGVDLSATELNDLLCPIDQDGDGKLKLYDFLALMQPYQPAADAKRPARSAPPAAPRRTGAAARVPFQPSHPHPVITATITDGSTDGAAVHRLVDVFEEKKLSLRKVFSKLDSDGDGSVPPEEFRQGLQSLGIEISPQRVDRLMRTYDLKKDGRLRYSEFVRMISAGSGELYEETLEGSGPNPEDAAHDDNLSQVIASISGQIYDKYRTARKAFQKFDKDCSKQIEKAEFVQVLAKLDAGIGEGDAEKIFAFCDRDGSGALNYSEFMRMLAASGDAAHR